MLIVNKNTGDELLATEFNQIPDEIEQVISDSGQAPSAADVEQLAKGIYRLASESSWYTDSGAADAYVLTSAGGVTDLAGNFDGKMIRFTPGNSNTTASTVNVNTDGITPLVDIAGGALVGGEILAGREVEATFISSSGEYRISAVETTREYSLKNLFINPLFLINQRAIVVATTIGLYFVDRWRIGPNSVNGATTVFASNMSIFDTGEIEQIIEAPALQNKTVTLSFLPQQAAGVPEPGVLMGRIEGAVTNSGAFQALPFTFTFGAGDTGNVRVLLQSDGVDRADFDGMQLEINDHATDFDFRPEALDRSMCLSYFEAIGAGGPLGIGFVGSSNTSPTTDSAEVYVKYTSKRVTPIISFNNVASFYDIRVSVSTIYPAALIVAVGSSETTIKLRVSFDGTVTVGQGVVFEAVSSDMFVSSEINTFP